ncbi:glutamate ABC transporter substrate-binding protein [Catenulispora yoronensis]|uniref:Glutamate ABC transporter substrate-binding protein n=1 Tax=Catenulispora yoronensis TaxID=450799 RepID=A0ABP5H028_9ACTN
MTRADQRNRGVGTALLAALLTVAAALTAACSTLPAPPSAASSRAAANPPQLTPFPDGVTTMPPGPSGGVPVSGCEKTPRPGPLPPPGQMPAGSTMARISQRGYLIAGVDEDSYLFGYRNPSTDPGAAPLIGFDIDFVREVAKAIFGSPDKVRYKAITKAQRISSLTDGSVDIVADIFTVDCERAKQVAFSSDYFDAGQRILVNQSSPVRSLADLAGRKACAAAGTTSIQTLANPAYHVVPVSAVNWADCLVMLQQGQVDAVSTTDLILLGLQIQDPYTTIVGPRFTYERHGLGMPLGEPDFVRFVNGVLEKIRADGTWTAIYTRWVGDKLGPVPAPPPPDYQ